MQRSLNVTIDENSWPKPPALPAYPPSFGSSPQNWDVNIPSVLLAIGYLTTPSHSSGVSLSEFWAWVRYLHAISASGSLRLTKAFNELDPHQKTILSDDFGMGMPVCWLLEKLNIGQLADGKYFVDRIASQVGATALKSKKRGPGKTPDFVARDTQGIWHILECKGTQTSPDYRRAQLGSALPYPTGAVAQKQTIVFPRGHTGQRLAAGLYIGVDGGAYDSSMHIIDPPPDDPFVVSEGNLALADDAISRAVAARSLRLAGFPQASTAMSAPTGARPDTEPLKGKAEEARREFVDEKRRQAEEELEARGDRTLFQSNGEKYRGRKVEIDLPSSISIGHRYSSSIVVRYGIGLSFLDELRRKPLVGNPIQEEIEAVRELQPGTKLDSDKRGASLHIGKSFVADIQFRS
jgi:hypothetical protein